MKNTTNTKSTATHTIVKVDNEIENWTREFIKKYKKDLEKLAKN